ncbi:MAG: CPBP family intramembrane metalloprotease [Clostridia bacterium]|nr:CPBP family intramembrane metalloprotease [Clostridia bacterium]
MTDKKLTVKRLLIFLSVAFVPPWIIQFMYIAILGCNVNTNSYQLIACVSMLFPAIGNFLARITTKEGFGKSYLKLNLKGNVKYYLTAVFVPVLYYFITAFVISMGYMPSGSTGEILRNANYFHIFSTSIYIISLSLLDCTLTFGEEFGWRGYLTPKLEELFKKPAAYLISGIIWGLWHAPVIVIGHNFGTDYKFYPYGGIILMCIFCIFIGTFYSVLTEKTESVFPSTFAHAINNNFSNIIYVILAVSSNQITEMPLNAMFAVMCLTVAVTSVLIIKNSKNKEYV